MHISHVHVHVHVHAHVTCAVTASLLTVALLTVWRTLENMLDARPATLVCFLCRESAEGALLSPPGPPPDGSSPGAPATPLPLSLTPWRPTPEEREERRSFSRRARALSADASRPSAESMSPPPPIEPRSPSSSSSESSTTRSEPSLALPSNSWPLTVGTTVRPLAPSAWLLRSRALPLVITPFELGLLAFCASPASLALFSLAAAFCSRSALGW